MQYGELKTDFAVAAAALRRVRFDVEEYPCSINAILPGSRLRIQLTIDSSMALSPTGPSRRFYWA